VQLDECGDDLATVGVVQQIAAADGFAPCVEPRADG
jgi:hypothetical protein